MAILNSGRRVWLYRTKPAMATVAVERMAAKARIVANSNPKMLPQTPMMNDDKNATGFTVQSFESSI